MIPGTTRRPSRWLGGSLFLIAALAVAGCHSKKKPPTYDGGGGFGGSAGGQGGGAAGGGGGDVQPTDAAQYDLALGDVPVDVSTTDVGPTNGDGGPQTPSTCPSASSQLPGNAVIIGWSYDAGGKNSLIAMRGDGSVVKFATVGTLGAFRSSGGLVLITAAAADMDAGDSYVAWLVDRTLNVRWRLTGSGGPPNGYLDGRTGAAIVGGAAILPDGTLYDLGAITPLGPPGRDGWVPFSMLIPNDSNRTYGFIKADTGEKRMLRKPVLGVSPPPVGDGVFYYQSWDDTSQPGIVVEDPDGANFYSTPVADPTNTNLLTRLKLIVTRAGLLQTVDGRPRWLLRDLTTLVDLGPLPGDDGSVVRTATGAGDWVTVVGGDNSPRWTLELSTGKFSTLSGFPVAGADAGATNYPTPLVDMNDRWAVGVDLTGRIWRVDLAAGTGTYLDLAPLRDFVDPCGRQPPRLLPDGSIVVGLRDDYAAGAFIQSPTETTWRRAGRPMVNVTGVYIDRIERLLLIHGNPSNIYCPHIVEPWTPSPAGADVPLMGGPSQAVFLPDTTAAAVNLGTLTVGVGNGSINASGDCAAWSGQVHNFVTGETFAFPATSAAWW